MHPKPIGALLEADDPAGRLLPTARQIVLARRLAAVVLPKPLQRSSSIAAIKQGKVVIFAENAAIAAKIRLYEPKLIESLGRGGLNVTGLRVEVQVGEQRPSEPLAKRARLTDSARESAARTAERLPDSPLKRALTSIATQD